MPLTKQSNELVHAVGQGGRDEAEAGCVTVDQVRVSARSFNCLLEVTLRGMWVICLKIKYASETLCLQSIIISRISSTILEL